MKLSYGRKLKLNLWKSSGEKGANQIVYSVDSTDLEELILIFKINLI